MRDFSHKLFESIGTITWVKTYDLDAACGLSGGGPAYVAMFVEALADGGVKEGLTRVWLRAGNSNGAGVRKTPEGYRDAPGPAEGHGDFSGRNHH